MHRAWANAFAGVVTAALAGCVTSNIPSVGRDAPGRHVFRASQYAFTTDFEFDRRDPLVLDLVGLRDRIFEELAIPPGSSVVRVIIFENQQRYVEFVRSSFPELPSRRAFFVKQGADQLAVFACRGERLQEDLRHEITHALLHSTLPAVPIWLDEGLAEYYEAGPDGSRVKQTHLTRLRSDLAADLEGGTYAGPRFDLRRLEGLRDLWHMTAADYREAWLWVHFCNHHSVQTRQALLEHVAALKTGRADSLAARLERVEPVLTEAVSIHLSKLTVELANVPATNQDDTYHRPRTFSLPTSFELSPRLP